MVQSRLSQIIVALLMGAAVGLGSAFVPKLALPPPLTYDSAPWREQDVVELRAREVATSLFRMGCREVRVQVRPARDDPAYVNASCVEWRQGR